MNILGVLEYNKLEKTLRNYSEELVGMKYNK